MELRINLDTQTDEMMSKVEEINSLTHKLSRAVRELEIMQTQKNTATVVANDSSITVALINYCTHIMGLSAKDLATKIGVCEATIYNRLQDPEKITLRELAALCSVVKQEISLPKIQIGGD